MKRLVIGALLLVSIASPQHYREDVHTANEEARVYAALALARGTAALDGVYDERAPGWRERGRPPNVDLATRDGRLYLDKAPLATWLATPVVAIVGSRLRYAELTWLLTLLGSALPSVLAALLLARRGGDEAVGVGLVLASPWLIYGGLFFGHALAAALVAPGALLALGAPLPDAPPPSRRAAFLGGLLLGAAVLAEYTCAIVAVVVCVAALCDPARRRRALPFVVAGGLAPALALMAWNAILFGGPLSFPYAHKASAGMAAAHAAGALGIGAPSLAALLGLLVSAGRGLFFLAPWLAFGAAGALGAAGDARLARAWRVALPAVVVVFPLAISGFAGWDGGRAAGPRYLVAMLPFLGIGAAWLMRVWPAVRPAIAGLVFTSFVAAAVDAYVFPYVSATVQNPLVEVNLAVLLADGPGATIWDGLCARPIGFIAGVAAGLAALGWAVRGLRGRGLLVAAVAATLHVTWMSLPSSADRAAVAAERRLTVRFGR